METKAYLMIKVDRENGNGHTAELVKELEAMSEVEAVIPVSGKYDLMAVATVDTPKKVAGVADQIQAKDWVKGLHILKVEAAVPNPFLDEVLATPGGETLRHCHQCGMCSASCPNVGQMDYSPRRIIALVRAGRRFEVLSSNTMWTCASCYLCTARCPQNVKITDIMHALERLSVRRSLQYGRNTATMYKIFIDTIKSNGVICEVGMMSKFYFSTILTGKMNPLIVFRMLPVAAKLLSHRRMPIRAAKMKEQKQLNAILKKAQALGGTQ
ncbi:MAG: 4Fe-4S dicluster domain-containing protein [Chloroflexota bacterium]|nr:4Fe-4S dicluster domain-containing protein [Chloroflexota bacterium]